MEDYIARKNELTHKATKAANYFKAYFIFTFVLGLGLLGTVIYVIGHFLSKYW